MAKFRTKYQKIADRIIEQHPTRLLIWHQNRLFWKARQGWLELVVTSTASWFQASEEATIELEKKNFIGDKTNA